MRKSFFDFPKTAGIECKQREPWNYLTCHGAET